MTLNLNDKFTSHPAVWGITLFLSGMVTAVTLIALHKELTDQSLMPDSDIRDYADLKILKRQASDHSVLIAAKQNEIDSLNESIKNTEREYESKLAKLKQEYNAYIAEYDRHKKHTFSQIQTLQNDLAEATKPEKDEPNIGGARGSVYSESNSSSSSQSSIATEHSSLKLKCPYTGQLKINTTSPKETSSYRIEFLKHSSDTRSISFEIAYVDEQSEIIDLPKNMSWINSNISSCKFQFKNENSKDEFFTIILGESVK